MADFPASRRVAPAVFFLSLLSVFIRIYPCSSVVNIFSFLIF